MTRIELVRHADAHGRGRWRGQPDRERPLSELGHQQAKALARELEAAGAVDALHSSPYRRCRQTLEPLADSLGMVVGEADALAEASSLPVMDGGDAWVASAWLGGRALALLDSVVATHPGGRVVLCSHGDVIPAVMAVLAGRDGLALPDLALPKGARFTLVFDGRRCVSAVPAPPPGG